jgi:hypothetical protein
MTYSLKEIHPCPRCGIARRVNPYRNTTHCLDCVTVMRRITDDPDLEPGYWVRRGVIWHWLSTPETVQNSDARFCQTHPSKWVA